MDISTVKNLAEIVQYSPFFLHYKGNYREDLTLNIAEIVEANLLLYFKKNVVNRISYLVIEAVQNIERYSASNGSAEDFCYLYSDKHFFHVITQNKVETKQVEGLKQRLDEVNSKTEEELKQIYMDTLAYGEGTSKGAGLGLIDLARKSKNALLYEFKTVDAVHSSYVLHLRIPLTDDSTENMPADILSDEVELLTNKFSSNKNTLFYSGDFSNTLLQRLLNMLNKVKNTDRLPTTSVFKYALIELNQNIKRHGLHVDGKIPGFLCLEWKENKAFISTYNFIEARHAAILEEKLIKLNRMSQEALEEESVETLTDFSVNGGLGLTDLARLNWPNKIQYKFEKDHIFGQSVYLKIQFNYG